jgi:hypothetical protein
LFPSLFADYPYIEIRYVSFPVQHKVPWNRKKALAEYPPDWLQDEGLKVKRLDGIMDQEHYNDSSLLLRCRLELLSCASRLQWQSDWNIIDIINDNLDNDDTGSECDSQNSSDNEPMDYEKREQRNNDEIEISNQPLRVKPFINSVMNGLGWDVTKYRSMLDECQLVSYSKDWKDAMEYNGDQLTEQERGIVDACIRIRKKEIQKFAHVLKVLEMSKKPLVCQLILFTFILQHCLTLFLYYDISGIACKDFHRRSTIHDS